MTGPRMSGGLGSRTTAPLRFYLGTHHASQKWFDLNVPLFVSTRTLRPRKTFPQPKTWWALDSGGFTELSLYGEFRTTTTQYAAEVDRYIAGGMTKCAFVSPQDWMCEPEIIHGSKAKGWPGTKLSVEEHQRRTIINFERLRDALGDIVIPVLQGWTRDDYHRHWEMYERWHFTLEKEPVVGLGSVCRRQNTVEAEKIVRSLRPLKLHYFGAKVTGLTMFGDALVSADSMAWSLRARRDAKERDRGDQLFEWPRRMPCGGIHPVPHRAKSCSNCIAWASKWRDALLEGDMEVAA